jgi:predicted porin
MHPTVLSATAAALALIAIAPAHSQTQAAAPASTSSVVVYGLFDAVVRHANNVAATGDATTMDDGLITGTRLGFRGTEDLGGGWRAGFVMESGFDPSTGVSLQGTPTADYGQEAASPRFWGREVNLNLRNDWGGVTLGRQYTTAHQIAARFQPLGNPNSTAHSMFSSHHVARQDNVVRLDTKLAGVEIMASKTVGEQPSDSANSSWSMGAGYARGDLYLGAFVQQMHNRAGTEERRIVAAGGNYKVNATLALFGGYMQRSSEVSPQKNQVLGLGANIEVADPVTLSLQYFNDRQTGSTALEGKREVAWVTANYRFSRRTDLYVLVDRNKVEGGYAKPAFMGTLGTQTAYNMGLRTRF